MAIAGATALPRGEVMHNPRGSQRSTSSQATKTASKEILPHDARKSRSPQVSSNPAAPAAPGPGTASVVDLSQQHLEFRSAAPPGRNVQRKRVPLQLHVPCSTAQRRCQIASVPSGGSEVSRAPRELATVFFSSGCPSPLARTGPATRIAAAASWLASARPRRMIPLRSITVSLSERSAPADQPAPPSPAERQGRMVAIRRARTQ